MPGQVLMPLAFGTILGGMTTLIGTPPNLIVSGFRAESSGSGFAMFDFTPVGLAVALAGVGFVVLIGWRFVPARKQAGAGGLRDRRLPDRGARAGRQQVDRQDLVRARAAARRGRARRWSAWRATTCG